MYKYCIKTHYEYYALPFLNPQFSTSDSIIINSSQYTKISAAKNQIDVYRYNKQWEKIKKITNPYELVYINDKSISYKSIANIEPISRSFFKLYEIIYNFLPNIIIQRKGEYESSELVANYSAITTLHLCESPGGFIAAMRYLRYEHPADKLFAISIRPTNKNIPSWHKSRDFLMANPQVKILYGADNTGNLYNPLNIMQLVVDLGGYNTCDVITGDGGFDFSCEFNNQEQNMSKLIFCQILAALINQKEGGTLILKIFDINYLITYDLIYILQCYYGTVTIYKPCISRIANSEKYLVCTGYKKIPYLSWCNLMSILYAWKDDINLSTLFQSSNITTIEKLKKINSEIVDIQVESINLTIELIKKIPNKEWLQFNNCIQRQTAVEWCRKYGIPINL